MSRVPADQHLELTGCNELSPIRLRRRVLEQSVVDAASQVQQGARRRCHRYAVKTRDFVVVHVHAMYARIRSRDPATPRHSHFDGARRPRSGKLAEVRRAEKAYGRLAASEDRGHFAMKRRKQWPDAIHAAVYRMQSATSYAIRDHVQRDSRCQQLTA
jgi:hypothetical protein